MTRLHRFIVLCLLALAIPLQGVAAVAMVHCGAAPMQMSAMDMEGMDMSSHAGMDDPGLDAAHAHAQAHAHKGSCSACAACCVVAAPGEPVAPSFGPGPMDRVAVPTARPRVAFLTDGPERPPRRRRG